jgi:hypothetical protein
MRVNSNATDVVGVADWERITTAPFDRDLELAIVDFDGAHALVFPCRRMLEGWIDAETQKRIEVSPIIGGTGSRPKDATPLRNPESPQLCSLIGPEMKAN